MAISVVLSYPRKVLAPKVITRLRNAGFTVGANTITSGTDGLLAKLVPGGKGTLRRLKLKGIRA